MVIHHVLPTILFGSGAESGWVGSHTTVVPPTPLAVGCAVNRMLILVLVPNERDDEKWQLNNERAHNNL